MDFLLHMRENLTLLILGLLLNMRGSAVVKALCYKLEGRGFDTK
jgi:hypothetical protein